MDMETVMVATVVDMEIAMVVIAMVDMEMAMEIAMVAIATVGMETAMEIAMVAMEDMEIAMVVMEEMVMEAAAIAPVPTINTFLLFEPIFYNFYILKNYFKNKSNGLL